VKYISAIGSIAGDRLHHYAIDVEIQPLVTSETFPIFHDIGIETISQCNGVCEFCPVNKHVDPRKPVKMSQQMFHNIVQQLHDLDYNGQICMNVNNEPLLDDRIYDFLIHVRREVPRAHLVMFTNGTLLTIEKFEKIIKELDELFIDNYNINRKYNKTTKEILEYLQNHPKYSDRVHINIIRPNAIRTTRAGTAPNRTQLFSLKSACIYPFWQITIQSTGRVGLCCNDATCRHLLGDVNQKSLVDIWYDEPYQQARVAMRKGRNNILICKQCNVFLKYPKIIYQILKILR
jgi:hypothetical protein